MRIYTKVKDNEGITLIALVITVIILIILATVTITLVFGEGGLIQRVQEGKELTEQAQKDEQDELKGAEEFINGVLAGTDLPETPEDEPYVDGSIVVAPQVSEGMKPVKYDTNQNKWVKTDETDSEWYDYGNKEWANVVLVGENGKDADGDQDVFNSDGTLNEESNYSMLVWIPRYAYKINSQYHQSGSSAGEIDIVFIDTANKGKDGSTTYSTEYPEATVGGAMSDYVVHPAFDYGGTALSEFWVGKFETSHTGCTTDISTGQTDTDNSTLIPQIKGNITSWRKIRISNMFDLCIKMNDSGNPYGLTENTDPHMMKNSEWGAVAYLSQNATYGKGNEVTINSNSSYLTGGGDYKTNVIQSTTENITGVYDMSGGAFEYVAAYIDNGNNNLTIYGSSLVNADAKYKDVYSVGSSDNRDNNYVMSIPANKHYGDAIWEISNSASSPYTNSWYSDYSYFPVTGSPFFNRGGHYDGSTTAGIFSFGSDAGGYSVANYSFRVVIPIL